MVFWKWQGSEYKKTLTECERFKNLKLYLSKTLQEEVAERTGLEPATSGVTGRRSNQLSYRSAFAWSGRAEPRMGFGLEQELNGTILNFFYLA